MVRALGCAGCELKPDEFLQQSRGWLAVLSSMAKQIKVLEDACKAKSKSHLSGLESPRDERG